MSRSKRNRKKKGKKTNMHRPVEDFVFRYPGQTDEISVCDLMDQGLEGINELAAYMLNWLYKPDAPQMYRCVSQELYNRLTDLLYDQKEGESLRTAMAYVTTIMDMIPNYGNPTYTAALEFGYDNAYDMLAHAREEELEEAIDYVVMDALYVFEKKADLFGITVENRYIDDDEDEEFQHFFRDNIRPGLHVLIVLKKDQKTGKLTEGYVKDILTPAAVHTRGIKVRLADGQIGRVKEILE